jgi:hypothetical protein
MVDGLVLGIFSWLSTILSWQHLPVRVKNWTLEHPIVMDLGMSLLTYYALSSISQSLVAAIATVVSGLLVNFSIMYILRSREYEDKRNRELAKISERRKQAAA